MGVLGVVFRLKQNLEGGGKCSVAVARYTLYLSLTATPLFLLVAVAIGLAYNAAHGSVWGSGRIFKLPAYESPIASGVSLCSGRLS